MANPHLIDLATADNVRELGGFPVAGGGQTKAHRFLRSGSTFELSRHDIHALRRYGVSRVVDLRGADENLVRPDPFARRMGVAYFCEPLYDYDMRDPKLAVPGTEDDGLAEYLIRGYLDILSNKPAFQRIFAFFAEARTTDCVLFHCAAGMDRTGVTSMLVLGLAGVDRVHIIADYAYSFADGDVVDERMRVLADEDSMRGVSIREGSPDIYTDALAVSPLVMGTVYDRVCSAYGSVEGYLRACEVPDAHLDAVRAHLLA